jgi:hypothetical protein
MQSVDSPDGTLPNPKPYDLDSSFEDVNRRYYYRKDGSIRNEKGHKAINPVTEKQDTVDVRPSITLFSYGSDPVQTTKPLFDDGTWDFITVTTTEQWGGSGEINKDGLTLDLLTAKYSKEIHYGDALRLPGWIDGLNGRLDVRSVFETSGGFTFDAGWEDGIATGAGMKFELVALQAPFELSFEHEFELFKINVSLTGAGNAGGLGAAIGAGGALRPRGVRAYVEGGLTPLVGFRARLNASIEWKPEMLEYASNPANNPLAPVGAWVGQQLYDATH